ncbi:hypothetical protein ElyMa_006303200 [Elysia marginata]|uniref:Uncharacterized protein n=1 Tax=Elysia marginata TaxID=1093978 RepID=A0AAV4HEH3_9GAST|nr:hypothetical protein ElyMa_006303200 [Elysia marginata]
MHLPRLSVNLLCMTCLASSAGLTGVYLDFSERKDVQKKNKLLTQKVGEGDKLNSENNKTVLKPARHGRAASGVTQFWGFSRLDHWSTSRRARGPNRGCIKPGSQPLAQTA